MSRKLFPVFALLLALSMVLAACGGAAPAASAMWAAPIAPSPRQPGPRCRAERAPTGPSSRRR